jgi:hypothetical protein
MNCPSEVVPYRIPQPAAATTPAPWAILPGVALLIWRRGWPVFDVIKDQTGNPIGTAVGVFRLDRGWARGITN